MTPFCFEHVFLGTRPADVFAAYFDPACQLEADRALEIVERELIEFAESGDEISRRCRVVPRRQLPALLRPFSSGPLHYVEHVVGRRATNELEIDVRLLRDRGRVRGRYELTEVAPGSVLRRYSGTVSVDVALVAARVERGIVAEFERSLARTATCTQIWLDQQTQRSVAARA
jgi:hypothetical protein